jgi:hypothetical protein
MADCFQFLMCFDCSAMYTTCYRVLAAAALMHWPQCLSLLLLLLLSAQLHVSPLTSLLLWHSKQPNMLLQQS